MDIDLRLPSGEHDKDEDAEPKEIMNMLDGEHKLGDAVSGVFEDLGEKLHTEDDGIIDSPTAGLIEFKEDINLEPLAGMVFESYGEAYSFYQEYARSLGFGTAIQNSRRSKTSKEFIDAKFACSRYGTKRQFDKPGDKPPRRQRNTENASGRRSCSKTDCKACMHVKRRSDGKWIIHRLEKEHNHELFPAQAVSEQTRRMYAAMAKQFAEYKNVVHFKNDSKNMLDKGRNIALEAGETNSLLDFFKQMQSMNSNFFYAVDAGEDLRLKNFFWVDGKCRNDYFNFNDVVSFDSIYVRSKYKMPLALFIGVNQHYQFMLLGCALLFDESPASLSWVMQTWLTAMGGQAPKVFITDKDPYMESVVSVVFPSTYHYFFLWNVLGKISENHGNLIKQNDDFLSELDICIYRSWTEEEFERKWFNLIDRFELRDNDLMQSLYECRRRWVPTYMGGDVILAGMSTPQRSESVNCFFDKYVHRKTSVSDFVRQYDTIIKDRYEEEAKADSDTWNKHPALKSPSPFEKHVSSIYSHAVLKRFQIEILGAVACGPKREKQDETSIIFRVEDFEKNQDFVVSWRASTSEVSCLCRLFEFKGFLCRHALIVLQMCGLSAIPSQYILKRWTKDAKSRCLIGEGTVQLQYRFERYNDLCQRAMKLGEEGSLSQESYDLALHALDDAYQNCVCVNNSSKNLVEAGTSAGPGLLQIEDNDQSTAMRTNKKKITSKKRKVNSETDTIAVGAQDTLQQMEKLSSRPFSHDGYFSPQQSMQGMVQLNLMAAPRDNYYGNQHAIQGLGQLNSIAPNHDSYFSSQPTIHSLGQMDFFRSPGFPYGIREEPNVRTAQLHDDASGHA